MYIAISHNYLFWFPVESGRKLKISLDVRWCQREFPSIFWFHLAKCRADHQGPWASCASLYLLECVKHTV